MKTRSLAASLLLALFACASAYGEQLLNAHYEINVSDHGSTNTVRSTFRLRSGESERLQLHPNTIELSVQPISDQEYELQVVVTPKTPNSAAVLDQKFRGKFGVPLELNSPDGAIQVSGAISVVVLEDKQHR